MEQSSKDILLKILEIIEYQNDKEKFVTEFELLNQTEALGNLLNKLPSDVQEKISTNGDIAEAEKNIGHDEYMTDLVVVANANLSNFINSVSNS